MSKVDEAAIAALKKQFGQNAISNHYFEIGFARGAAWQREQDAKIADSAEKRHLAMEDPTSAAVCGQVAAMIREQSKQACTCSLAAAGHDKHCAQYSNQETAK